MKKTIKSDLFRFAMLRAPQLLSEEDKKKGFIFHPDLEESSIYTTVISKLHPDRSGTGQSPAEYEENFIPALPVVEMRSIAAATTGILSKRGAEQLNAGLMGFARWLSRNRQAKFLRSEIEGKTGNATMLTESQLLQVWENIFYQTITRQSTAAREALIELLVAHHFLYFFTVPDPSIAPGENPEVYEDFTITANAKVVIPRELVAAKPQGVAAPGTHINTAFEEKNTETFEKLELLKRYQQAVTELQREAKRIDSSNYKASAAAYRQYLQDTQAIMDAYVPEEPEGENPGTILPKIPAFDFPMRNTLHDVTISEKAKGVINTLRFQGDVTIMEAIASIEDAMQELNNSFGNTVIPHQKMVVLDHTLFETNTVSRILPENPFDELYAYRLCNISADETTGSGFNIALNAGYANAQVQEIDLLITDAAGNSNRIDNFESLQSTGNNVEIRFGDKLTGSARVAGTITLSNDTVLSVDGTVGKKVCIFSTAKFVSDAPQNEPTPLIGIHQMGIADYRRVEQEVCCYLPGEVSHIENILQGEYKERSTRRLKRSEETVETSIEREIENLTDTSTTQRNEMHNEVSKVLTADRSITANAGVSGSIKGLGEFFANAGYASNTSQTDSSAQAVSYAKDVTARAMERVVQKISEKRTSKMIDEFEETDKHGFDNRGTSARNVSGVYRWVDKVYKNQVVNYGKRLMYEIMVPEPARFLTSAASAATGSAIQVLKKPVDPRSYLSDASMINAANYQYFAAQYNAEVAAPPVTYKSTGQSFSVAMSTSGSSGPLVKSDAVNVKLPEGYYTINAKTQMSGQSDGGSRHGKGFSVGIGNAVINHINTSAVMFDHPYLPVQLDKFVDEIPVTIFFCSFYTGQITVSINLQVLPEYIAKWQNETYNAVIAAYEASKKAYEDAVANATAGIVTTGNNNSTRYNPLQARMIESAELKKNCLQLLLEPYGMATGVNTLKADGTINISAVFGSHASKVKFFEAAFEWEIMSYIFYPYCWADKAQWNSMFNMEDGDPLFKSFLQAGMSKVVLSVRPGFEEAVMYYLQTGQVWDGKDLAIDDDLYLSILAEQLPAEGTPEGEPWETKLPTSLTVLQADSVSVKETGLPCACDDGEGNGFESNSNAITLPLLP